MRQNFNYNMKIPIILFSLIFITDGLFGNNDEESGHIEVSCWNELQDTNRLTLLFVGDVMGHDSQIASAFNDSTKIYEYDGCFKYVSPFIKEADVAIANLEVTLAGSPFKGYPQFSSPDNLATALQNAGFDILITANNHSLDRSKKGLERTIDVLDSLNIIHTGTFKDSLERVRRYPLVFDKNNIKVALLNYTYGTNGLEVTKPNIVNYIDTAHIRMDLRKAKTARPDFTIVTIHWGLEYQRTENSRQKALAEFMLKHGADAIIGSHPHVIQPIKKYYSNKNDTTIYNIVVYSLGNYISNQRKRYTDGGIMFNMELVKTNYQTKVKTYDYLPTWVFKPRIDDKTVFTLVPAISYMKGLGNIKIDEDSKQKMKLFYEDTKLHLKDIPENDYYYKFEVKEDKNQPVKE